MVAETTGAAPGLEVAAVRDRQAAEAATARLAAADDERRHADADRHHWAARQEAPGRPVSGKVVHTAGAIDPATRTLQVEVMVANADHGLMPGQYVDASFRLPVGYSLTLPTNARQFGAKGGRVALVGADNKVHLQPVAVGTDYGHEVEIRSGLKPEDRVIVNPPDSINDGQPVTVVAAAKGD